MKKIIELKPIRETPQEYDRIKAKITELFREEIYLPLMEELGASKKNLIKNSTDDLLDAITGGQIYFYRGKFTGKFNSTISRELYRLGARWNKKESAFEIPRSKLRVEIKSAIDLAHTRFQRTAEQIDKKISSISPEEIAEKLKVEHIFDATLWKVNREFEKSIKGITVAPQLTAHRRERIAQEYTENLKLHIQGWIREEVVDLREKIQKSAFQGFRYESMVKTIQKSYGVSENKAQFLARQETNLLISKFKEVRYADSGVKEYKWKSVVGSPHHPVRPRHQKLNDLSMKGELFRFDQPPIVTEPGQRVRRGNPGEDFGCRCIAIPVVKF